MPTTVTRKKSYALAFKCADDKGVRGTAEWRVDVYLFDVAQLRHLVETTSSNDANSNLGTHFLSLQLFALTYSASVLFERFEIKSSMNILYCANQSNNTDHCNYE